KPVIDSVLGHTLSIIEKVGSGLINTIRWIKENKNVIELLIGALISYKAISLLIIGIEMIRSRMAAQQILANIGNTGTTITLTTAQALQAVVTSGLSGAQLALNAAMKANPIGLIITGLTVLVGIVMLAWNKCEGFRRVIFSLWEVIKEFGIMVGRIFKGLGEIIAGVFTFDPVKIAKGLNDIIDVTKNAGENFALAWESGKEKGEASFAKSKSLIPGKTGDVGKDGKTAPAIAPKEPKTKAEGQKNINIHIAYNAPLIQGFTISTTNIKEGLGSLKEQVTAILTGATHDSLIVADY
ncbi:MAG: hypothetical protein WC886_06245, partial [Saccharofermentanaceae bacterium]